MNEPRKPEARAISRGDAGDWTPGISPVKTLFMLAALLSFLASAYLFFTGDTDRGIFVGIWVPSILSAGALLLGRSESD